MEQSLQRHPGPTLWGHLVGSQKAPDVSPVHTAQTTTGAEERGRPERRHSRPEEGKRHLWVWRLGWAQVNMAREATDIYNLSQVGGQHWAYWAWLTPEESLGKVDSCCTPERTKAYSLEEPLESPPTLAWIFLSRWSQGCSPVLLSRAPPCPIVPKCKVPCAVAGLLPTLFSHVMSTRPGKKGQGLPMGSLVPAWGQ